MTAAMRNGVALLGASLISFGLFWVMYQLVLGGEAPLWAEIVTDEVIDALTTDHQSKLLAAMDQDG